MQAFSRTETDVAWLFLAIAAILPPTLLAFNLPPSATFLNQAAANLGWGLWLAAMAFGLPRAGGVAWRASRGLVALVAALGLLALAAFAAPLWAGLPSTLALSSIGLLFAAVLAVLMGAAVQQAGGGQGAFKALCIALVVAGVCSSAIGVIQVFAPQLTDGDLIARSVLEGRAVGNLRQPNHLSSLLLWGIVAALWLGEAKVIERVGSGVLSFVFIFVVVLSASRTGAVGAVMLAAWGVLDRRLSPTARRLLWLMPVAYAVFWLGTSYWADHSHHVFGGETRFSGAGDISSSRFGIWSNTLSLIAAHPWFGVGFGEFNFAWTLTPFPGRPVAFFDHTHNLPLQLAVELGVPLAALVLALMLWALFSAFARAWRAARRPYSAEGVMPLLPAAFMMVLMVTVHSLLEYPLWYAYFLLPCAFAFGLCLGGADHAGDAPDGTVNLPAAGEAGRSSAGKRAAADAAARRRPEAALRNAPLTAAPAVERGHRPLLVACALLLLGAAYSLYDYTRVVVIFAPPEDAAPLLERIEAGRRSVFFGHHADYAAATTFPHPSAMMSAFRRAPHYLLDVRLMTAWATALHESGDDERARYVAQRMKEFRNPQADSFFAVCDEPLPPNLPKPFQCTPPTKPLSYADFR